ncbi:hypothetical protein [Sorangium sp. So ce854]|uniref:hypothetical protein n=1 Tax=Sorangium sp. So ce854 TaxID=3133322 RepID=UPI003F604FF7
MTAAAARRSPGLAAGSAAALARALGPLALLVAPALAACGAADPAAPGPGAPDPEDRALGPLAPLVALGPARYVAQPAPGLVERVVQGGREIDRVVVSGRRAELHGVERLVPVGDDDGPELAGGAAFPAWARPGAPPGSGYVFWSDRDLYTAGSFSGELRALAPLPGDVVGVFPWLDGIGLVTSAGAFAVHGASGALRALGLPSIVAAAAASERRALGLTAFGRALLTLDAGASYRDVTAEFGEAVAVDVRGEAIVAWTADGLERAVDAGGRVGELRAPRAQRPAGGDAAWPDRAPFARLAAAVDAGLPLGDGGAAVAEDGLVGRVDLATGRASSSAPLPPGSGACAPFRASDALLAVCVGTDRASVVDISADARALRIDRAFELRSGEEEAERFVGVDGEALGYVGPCEGLPRPRLDLRAISRGALAGGSTHGSAAFCVRRGPGAWVEHRLDPADAIDVLGWIPRRGGGAVALVARPGASLRDEERVEERGALRVVRLARGEPPLSLPRLPRYGEPALLSRALAVLADDTVEGWLPAQDHAARLAPVAIDAAGRLRRYPLPARASALAASGPFALVETEDGRFFETIDRGKRWAPVAPPPGSGAARVEGCSAVGCRVGPFLRIGWSTAPRAGAAPAPGAAVAEPPGAAVAEPPRGRAPRDRDGPQPPLRPAPVARLDCSFAGPPAAARVPESPGFGAVAASPLRGSGQVRLGTLGVLTLPSFGGALPARGASAGDAELAWIAPLDLRAEIRRAVVPLTSAALAQLEYRPYEAQVALVIDRDGRVAPVAAGPREACLAGVLDAALATRPIGGCAPLRSVGVDLGDRAVFLSARYDGLAVSAVGLRAGARRAWPAGAPPAGLRELHVQRTARASPSSAQQPRFAYGAGARDRAPVFVAVSGGGGAVLSPVDPGLGALGPEEALASLGELAAGSAPSCAPRRGEARVVLPFDSEIGLVPGALPGVIEAGTAGVAVIRWSRDRACLDAVELNVRDERYEIDPGFYEATGAVKKLVARFAGPAAAAPPRARGAESGRPSAAPARPVEPPQGAGAGTLVLVTHGQEVRQPVRCTAVAR